MNAIIVSAQGFCQYDQGFVVKELSVILLNGCCDSCDQFNIMFQPPKPFDELTPDQKHQVMWSTENIHGIEWNHGDIEYEELRGTIQQIFKDITYIYVSDCDQKDIFQQFIKESQVIINLAEMGYGSNGIKTLEIITPCASHQHHNKITQDTAKFMGYQSNARLCQKHYYFDQYTYKYDCAAMSVQLQFHYIKRFIKVASLSTWISQIYLNLGSINRMEMDDIRELGEALILKNAYREINDNWAKLPYEWHNTSEFFGYLHCTEHENPLNHEIMYKKDCVRCLLSDPIYSSLQNRL